MKKNALALAVAAISGQSFRLNLMPEGVKLTPQWAMKKLREMNARGIGPFGEMEFGGAPNWSELGAYAVMRPDAVEAVRQPLYDSLLYPTAGQTQLRFFQNPQGAGLSVQQGNAGNPKTLADTNMELAGQLANPKAFLCTSIEIIFEPGSGTTGFAPQVISGPAGTAVATTATIGALTPANAQNDVQAALASGWLDLFLISKSYLQNARGDSFPPKSHLQYDGSISTGGALLAAVVGAGARAVGRPFYVNPPVLIMPNTNFSLTMNWPVAVATPSGFNGRVLCRLDGFLYRNAQ